MVVHGQLNVRTWREGSVGCVKLTGELDLATREAFAATVADLVQDGVDSISVDATELTFCDSSGINVLLGLKRAALAEDKEFSVVNLRSQVARLWKVVGVLDYLTDVHPIRQPRRPPDE